MRLYLMRHGIAVDRDDPNCPSEKERYLTPKGVERTRQAAAGLRGLGIKPTAFLTSPYVRAVQTGETVCDVLDADPKMLHVTDALKPEGKPAKLAEELSRMNDEEVICFGHAPQLDEFLAFAVQAPERFTELKKAGVARLDVENFTPVQAMLAWLLSSRALRHFED